MKKCLYRLKNFDSLNNSLTCNWTKCLKNQPHDVIKMWEMRGEVGKKTPKKDMDNPSSFETLCPVTFNLEKYFSIATFFV